MARSSSSSSSDVDENISPNNVKFETDEAKFSLQPYLFEPTIKKGYSSSSDSELRWWLYIFLEHELV